MARRIRIQNPLVENTFKTYVSTDYVPATSTTSLQVTNTTSFTANDLLVIGEPTEELTELKQLSVVADIDTLTLTAALSFSHNKGTGVYKTSWDTVVLESRASSAGTFTTLASVLLQWDNKENETIYYDASGTDATEYRFRFYNSVTLAYAEYSPTLTGVGFTKKQVGYMIKNVRLITNDTERKIVTDDEIIRHFNTAQDIIYGRNPKYWFLLVDTYKGANGISTVGATNVYDLDTYSNFGHLDRVRFNFNDGTSNILYDLKNKSAMEFDTQVEDLSATGDDYADSYKLLPADASSTKGYIQLYPTPVNAYGTIYPLYYKEMDSLDSVDDETLVPLPQLLENFAIAQVEKVKGNDTKAEMYEKMFFGTAPKKEAYEPLQGLALLDSMDDAKKRPQGQPRSLWVYRGQTGGDYYGQRMSSDEIKEKYF